MWHFFNIFFGALLWPNGLIFSTFPNCSEEILTGAFKKCIRFGPSSSRTRAKAVWSWWRWRWWWWWFEAPLSPKLQTALARFLDELQSLVKTRSSALGTSDPIWGPHPYFCGWKEELGRIRLLDQVNFEVWVVKGKDEQRRKRKMILREGVLFCWGDIKWRWTRKTILGKGKWAIISLVMDTSATLFALCC